MALASLPVMMDNVLGWRKDVIKYQIAGGFKRDFRFLFLLYLHFPRDESDENDCKMLAMKENYNKKIAPIEYDYVNSKVIPANVYVSMVVLDVLSISEVDLVYVLKFRILMNWYDSRLTYHNLKEEQSLNSLSSEEIDKIWIPFVVFANTENQESTKGNDETQVTVTREGNFTESSVDVLEEINIFEGVQNRITFQQVYSKSFRCVYQLHLYPFDTQV